MKLGFKVSGSGFTVQGLLLWVFGCRFLWCASCRPQRFSKAFCWFIRVLYGALKLYGFYRVFVLAFVISSLMWQHRKHRKPKPKMSKPCAGNLETDVRAFVFSRVGVFTYGVPLLGEAPTSQKKATKLATAPC